jgi:uncharacterized protein DUF6188
MMDTDTKQRLTHILVGSVCTEVSLEGGYLIILFGTHGLTIGCAWRLMQGEGICVGSNSDATLQAQFSALLMDRRVRQVALVNDCHDLRVEFDRGMILETFADSEQYEHWHVGGGPDEMIIAGPGKLWSSF